MNTCYNTADCAEGETCRSDGTVKTCRASPPKYEPGTLPTLPPGERPKEQDTEAWKKASNQVLVLTDEEKKKVLSGRGFITELIVVLFEFCIMIFKAVLALYKFIWHFIFAIVSWILLGIFKSGNGAAAWGEKYKCKNKKRIKKLEEGDTILVKIDKIQKKAIILKKIDDTFEVMFRDGNIDTIHKDNIEHIEEIDGECNCHPKGCRAYTLRRLTVLKIITYLFPPYGVFLKKGLSGIGDIIITSILTVLLYFPGLIYGLSIVDDGETCHNSITVYTDIGRKGKYEVLQYGDYNMYDDILNKLNPCQQKYIAARDSYRVKNIDGTFKRITPINNNTGASFIYSIKLGSKVKAVLYASNDFTKEIATIEDNVDDLSYLEKKFTEKCNGSKQDFVSIKAISIVPKDKKELKPVGNYEVVVYEFIHYRGSKKMITLDELEVLLKETNVSAYFDAPELGYLANNISSIRVGAKVEATLIPASFSESNSGGSADKEVNLNTWIEDSKASGYKLKTSEDIPNLFNTKKGNVGLMTLSILLKKNNR